MVNKMDLTTLKEWMARIACLVLLMVSVSVAEASHFRFGHFTYCSGSMIPDTHQGGNIAILNEVSDDQKTTFFFA
jgi:hypothetical protein